MPSATPRGTDRRVKRHSDGARIRCATGFRRRLRAMCSRVGMCRRTQAPIAEDAPTSAAIPEQAPLFALPVAFLDRLALVVGLLALGKRQFALGAAARVEIDRPRHQRHTLAGDSAVTLVDLVFVE